MVRRFRREAAQRLDAELPAVIKDVGHCGGREQVLGSEDPEFLHRPEMLDIDKAAEPGFLLGKKQVRRVSRHEHPVWRDRRGS
jgi:hypothetical protein